MLIVTHIPKTGGTSFALYLRQVFGTRLYLDYSHRTPAPWPWWRQLLGVLRGEKMQIPRETSCIIGHFHATKYDRAFPRARHAVWLRDPVERVVSNYHYFLSNPDSKNPVCRRVMANQLSLENFALRVKASQDMQYRTLKDKPLRAFDFVGVTEHYQASLVLFARLFGLPEPPAAPQRNRNRARQGERYALEPGLREAIRRANPQDEQLYREGLERFTVLCARHGVSSAAGLAESA